MLTLFLGPMFAGKTKALIEAHKCNATNTSTLVVKPIIDNRYSGNAIVAHDKTQIPAIGVATLTELKERADAITQLYIDEGQFFSDLGEVCTWFLQRGCHIWVAGLNATYQQRPWKSINDVIALADHIIFIHVPCCHKCHQRPGVHTILCKQQTDASTILIGGFDTYMTVCKSCLWGSSFK